MNLPSDRRAGLIRLAAACGIAAGVLVCLAALCTGCGAPGPTTGQKFRDLFGVSSVDDEIQGLSSDEPVVRRWSVLRLAARGRIEMAPEITLLVSRKLEESPDVRAAAAAALRELSAHESSRFLARNLDDPNPYVRRQVIETLGSVGGPEQVPNLLSVVSSRTETPELRSSAARAIGDIGDQSAAPGLIDNLENSDASVAASVHEALVRVAQTDMGLKKGPWQQWWDQLPKQPAGGTQ